MCNVHLFVLIYSLLWLLLTGPNIVNSSLWNTAIGNVGQEGIQLEMFLGDEMGDLAAEEDEARRRAERLHC